MDGKFVTIVRNFRNGEGWETVVLGEEDIRKLQSVIRQVNKDIVEESLYDACDLTARYGTLYQNRMDQIIQLGMFLASKRIIDARTVYEEFARQQIWLARKTSNGEAN